MGGDDRSGKKRRIEELVPRPPVGRFDEKGMLHVPASAIRDAKRQRAATAAPTPDSKARRQGSGKLSRRRANKIKKQQKKRIRQ
jgi:hypothetical protein